MTKIMFVCHGNICHSPMAEFIFKDIVSKNGAFDKFFIASSATSTEEIWNGIGNPVYPPAQKELAIHGISCDGKRAVLLKKEDYEKYDLILCMDDNNIHNALRILGNDHKNKVKKLLSYAGSNRDISDPWYSGDFKTAYKDIYSGCKALYDSIKNRKI